MFHNNPDWLDISPIPQDDGPDPVVPINYTDEFTDAMDYFRAVLHREEMSPRALKLTGIVIELNSANYTVWQYRRRVLDHLNGDLQAELRFLNELILDGNTKNYQVWHHRAWLLGRLNSADLATAELAFVDDVLESDAKNYHAWSYRQWVLKNLGGWDSELDACSRYLADDVWNNSAWNHRLFVIKNSPLLGNLENARESELEFCKEAILTFPANESPWRYLEGVYGNEFKKMIEDGKLLRLCNTALAKDSECIFAFRLVLELLLRGASCTECDFTALGIEKKDSATEVCSEICDILIVLDPVRSNYWKFRRQLLTRALD